MSHLLSFSCILPQQIAMPVAELGLRTLEQLLVIGTVVIFIALFLIAINLKKSPIKTR